MSTNPIPPEAKLERVASGITFAEGPAADAEGNVYFSDCPENRILVYRPATGVTEVWKEPSDRANGMNFDAQGRLVVCCDGKDGGARAVRRSCRGRCPSAFSALSSASTNGASLVGISRRRYFGSAPCGAFSHFLIVLRDRLVSRAISLIDFPCRKCIERILPIMAMVITPLSLLLKKAAG